MGEERAPVVVLEPALVEASEVLGVIFGYRCEGSRDRVCSSRDHGKPYEVASLQPGWLTLPPRVA